MRAISLWQPHASFIMLGVKPYETRSWAAHRPLIGKRIWIHAAKAKDDILELAEYCEDLRDGLPPEEPYETFRRVLVEGGFTKFSDIPLGCILGSAMLAWSRPTTQIPNPGPFGDFSPGRYAWHMTEIIPLRTPVPFKGMQGFFDVPDDLPGLHDVSQDQMMIEKTFQEV